MWRKEMLMSKVEVVHKGGDNLGECPVWNQREQSLYWVDCTGSRISAITSGGAVRTWMLPELPGSFAFRENGGLMMAFRKGLAFVNLDAPIPEVNWLADTGIDHGMVRFNDGACDRHGRFWAGTFHRKMTDRIGGLYRVDADTSVRQMDTGIMSSNGIAWSPDNRTMYYTDSRPGVVYAYDFDLDEGSVRNRRVFLDYSTVNYGPDGCAIDSMGCLWVAEVRGSRVTRYRPDGKPDSSFDLPVTRPSSVAFGGPDLSTLYITTLVYGMGEEERAGQPLAGSLLALNPGVTGLPQPRFQG